MISLLWAIAAASPLCTETLIAEVRSRLDREASAWTLTCRDAATATIAVSDRRRAIDLTRVPLEHRARYVALAIEELAESAAAPTSEPAFAPTPQRHTSERASTRGGEQAAGARGGAFSPFGATLVERQGFYLGMTNAFYKDSGTDPLTIWSHELSFRYVRRLFDLLDVFVGGRFAVGPFVLGGTPIEAGVRLRLHHGRLLRFAAAIELRPLSVGEFSMELTRFWSDFRADLRLGLQTSARTSLDLVVAATTRIPIGDVSRPVPFHVIAPSAGLYFNFSATRAGLSAGIEWTSFINMISPFRPPPLPYEFVRYHRVALVLGSTFGS